MESILIYVAMLCKKRVFVYHDKLADLQQLVRSFPLLGAWHRQSFDLLRPASGLSETELKDISSSGFFVAGFTDPACADKKDMYDLFVNVPERKFVVAEHAKGESCARRHSQSLCSCATH